MVQRIAATAGLVVVDMEQLSTHGGSLRVWLAHQGATEATESVTSVLAAEAAAGLESLNAYEDFQRRAETAKNGLLVFLLQAKRKGRQILGYGAAAKGNTLLNYAGIRSDLLPAVADRASSKQGKFLPGSHIPVITPEQPASDAADALLVLPWNLIDEVQQQFPNKELITAIPELRHWQGGH